MQTVTEEIIVAISDYLPEWVVEQIILGVGYHGPKEESRWRADVGLSMLTVIAHAMDSYEDEPEVLSMCSILLTQVQCVLFELASRTVVSLPEGQRKHVRPWEFHQWDPSRTTHEDDAPVAN